VWGGGIQEGQRRREGSTEVIHTKHEWKKKVVGEGIRTEYLIICGKAMGYITGR
jgi:hypothetical protein